MSKAEEQALKAYPSIKIGEQHIDQSPARDVYVQGYEQVRPKVNPFIGGLVGEFVTDANN